jgi:exonuclease III
MTLIQWNIRGLQANRQDLNLLLSSNNADIACLQETFVSNSTNLSIKNYCFYGTNTNNTGNTNTINHGGVAILVKHNIPHKPLTIQTNLQAVAIRATCVKTFTVCSVYLPPSCRCDATDLTDLIDQLPPPVLLLGDFNAHNTLWGCRNMDTRGKMLEDIILKYNMSLLNDGSVTYLHPATGSKSAIDLSMCDPSMYLDFDWSVHDDLCGSDHFPVILKSSKPVHTTVNQTWKLTKADWCGFAQMCSTELGTGRYDLSMEEFTA